MYGDSLVLGYLLSLNIFVLPSALHRFGRTTLAGWFGTVTRIVCCATLVACREQLLLGRLCSTFGLALLGGRLRNSPFGPIGDASHIDGDGS